MMPAPFTPAAGQLGAMAAVVATHGLPPAQIPVSALQTGGNRQYQSASPAAGAMPYPSPDAELLRLGELLDAASQRENAAWAEADRVDAEDDDPEWLTAAALQHHTLEIVEQIEALPATTLAGALVKVRAINWCRNGEEWTAQSIADPMEPSTDTRLLAGLLRDLAAIGGHA